MQLAERSASEAQKESLTLDAARCGSGVDGYVRHVVVFLEEVLFMIIIKETIEIMKRKMKLLTNSGNF